jgi:hypothetical protein
MHSVYIATRHESGEIGNFKSSMANLLWFKIGRSNDPKERMVKLREKYGFKCHLISEYEFESIQRAHDVEQSIHKLLKGRQRQGEWWRMSFETLKVIDVMLIQIAGGNPCYLQKEWIITPSRSIKEMIEYSKVPALGESEFVF